MIASPPSAQSPDNPDETSPDKVGLIDMLAAMRSMLVAAERFRASAADHLGIAIGDVMVLSFVEYPSPVTPTELAARLGREGSTITAALDRLESADMITRTAHPIDGRKTIVRLSPRGQRAVLWIRAFSEAAFANLNPSTVGAITHTFTAVDAAIEAQLAVLTRETVGTP